MEECVFGKPEIILAFLKKVYIAEQLIEIYEEGKLLHGFLKSISKNFLKIEPIKNVKNTTFSNTELFEVQFVLEKKRYQFFSHLLRENYGVNVLVLETPLIIRNINVRRHPRFNLNIPLKICFSFKERIEFGFIKNISAGGLLIVSSQPLEEQSEYFFATSFFSDGALNPLFFKAKVVHLYEKKKGAYVIGLEFIDFYNDVKNCLRNFIWALDTWDKLKENSSVEIKKTVHTRLLEMRKQDNVISLVNQFTKFIDLHKSSPEKSKGKKKILCIEPNYARREDLKTLLSSYYQLNTVTNLLTVNAEIEKFEPHLVISDVEFNVCSHEMNFITLYKSLRRAKGSTKLKKIPFVIYTANGDKKVIIETIQGTNVHEYIVKPIMPQELVARINRVLDSNI